MNHIRAIRSEADYETALARIDDLMDAESGTPEGEELDVLTDLVELYETKHVPMGFPSPLGAIRFRMEQGGLSPRDLIPFMGSRAKVPISVSPLTCCYSNRAVNCIQPSKVPSGAGFHWQKWQNVGGSRSDGILTPMPKKSCGILFVGPEANMFCLPRSSGRMIRRV